MISSVMETGIIGRALKNELISFQTVNIRDFADNNRAQVDDYPYGGGAGQVIQAQPVFDAFFTDTILRVCGAEVKIEEI